MSEEQKLPPEEQGGTALPEEEKTEQEKKADRKKKLVGKITIWCFHYHAELFTENSIPSLILRNSGYSEDYQIRQNLTDYNSDTC